MLESMGADLIAEIPPGERYAATAREWLDSTLREVFPDLLEGLRDRPALRKDEPGRPVGEPGELRGELWLGVTSPVPRRGVLFSNAAWQRMLNSLAKSPLRVLVSISQLGDDGFRCLEEAHIGVARSTSEPAWVRFTFSAPASFRWRARLAESPVPGSAVVRVLRYPAGSDEPVITEVDASEAEKAWPGPGGGWPASRDLQDRWAGFVRRQAEQIGASAGFMNDDRAPGGDTALQQAIWPPASAYPFRYREILYGYSWVTIVPSQLAGRLGGPAAMRSSGAFSEVDELPGGAVWLRATPAINQFTGDRIRAVFEVLAPVLLTGRTKFMFGYEPRLVEGVDAADYRQ